MAIAWSRISSKFIVDPPYALWHAEDRVGIRDTVSITVSATFGYSG